MRLNVESHFAMRLGIIYWRGRICRTALLGPAPRSAGYDVNLADSGQTALDTLAGADRPDAVLLDLKLGDMTGYDVLRWMRSRQIFVAPAALTAFHLEFNPDDANRLGRASVCRSAAVDRRRRNTRPQSGEAALCARRPTTATQASTGG